MKKNIVLIGFMGTGKSRIGQLLAKKLNFSFVDTDNLVEKKMGMTIPQIFSEFGEERFRSCEKEVVRDAASRSSMVISTGGGVPMFEENRQALKENSVVICLCASIDVVLYRTRNRSNRPLLSHDKNKMQQLLDKRRPFYNEANFIIDTDDLSPMQVVGEIMTYLRRVKT